MEPLASISPIARSSGGGETGGALHEGRLVVAEVLKRLDRQNVLVQAAGQRVPAETGVELEPGERFLARVERQGDGLALRLLPGERVAADPGLLEAVRHLLGAERPLGQVLGDLEVALRAADGDPRRDALLAALKGRQLDPEGGAEALRALLAADREAWPAALAAALAEVGEDGLESSLRSLAAHLRHVLGLRGAASIELSNLEHGLAAALRALGLEPAPGRGLQELGQALTRLLARELQSGGIVRAAGLVRDAGAGLFAGRELDLMRALLHTHGALGPRSEAARALADRAFGALGGSDLRGQLASLLLDLEAGSLRELAGRALAGLDLEDLLNAVRREAGEGAHLSLPLPDGDGWTTAHLLLLSRDPEHGPQAESGGGAEASYRVVIGVEFTRLGKVRADLLVRGGALAARLRASRPGTAALLRASRPELEQLLGGEGRKVTLTVLDGTDAEVSVEHLSRDVKFLREHHLMDVEG